MGDKTERDSEAGFHLPGHLSHLTWETFPDYVRDTHVAASEPDILALTERLDGLAIRDQPAMKKSKLGEQRKRLRDAAVAITQAAAALHDSLETRLPLLRAALADFNAAAGYRMWSAPMLEEVFDISYVDSTAVEPPELFDPIRGFFASRERVWRDIEVELKQLASLPIRSRLHPNQVRNHVLEQALLYCRDFWLLHQNKLGWSGSSLSEASKMNRDRDIPNLKGNCERFVVDMTTYSNLDFDLKRLDGAWSAVDKRIRASNGGKSSMSRLA